MSIIKKELLTDGLMHIALLLSGISYYIIGYGSLLSVILQGVFLAIMLLSLIVRRAKSEPLDEMTNAYYNEARKATLKLVQIIIVVIGLCLLILQKEFAVTSGLILIILGLIGLFQSAAYVWIEHKNSKGLED